MPPTGLTPPELRDGRDVVLRRHRDGDIDAIVELCRDEDMRRWTTVPVPYERSDAQWFLDHVARGWAEATMAAFAIQAEDRFAGSVDLRLQDAGPTSASGSRHGLAGGT